MGRQIVIHAGSVSAEAGLNDSATAELVYNALPIEARGNLWGEEIYFQIPVETGLDDTAKELVEAGDIGYWPEGKAFCIFFGPTPVSGPGEIRPAGAVNIIGKVKGDPKRFLSVKSGELVKLEKKEDS